MQWIYDDKEVDFDEVSNLYKIAPLSEKPPKQWQAIFQNSSFKCFIYDDGKLVGAGRVLSDGIDVSYICDVAIHPDYQGKKIGKAIMEKILEYSKDCNKIILFASVGKEPFYAKLGFDKLDTAMAIFKNRERVLEMGIISKWSSHEND